MSLNLVGIGRKLFGMLQLPWNQVPAPECQKRILGCFMSFVLCFIPMDPRNPLLGMYGKGTIGGLKYLLRRYLDP